MINLLPPEKKEELFLEQIKKIVLVLGGTAVASLVCFALILLAIKFFILKEIISQKSIYSGIMPPGLSAVKGIAQKYNAMLPGIKIFYSQNGDFSNVLSNISGFKASPGISFLEISLAKGDGKNIKAVILGKSNKRDDMIAFKDIIENDPKIKNSQFSPDSWIKETNANFSLTFEFLNENIGAK
ncbi:MAG: hypothetical protein A2599_00685 [Candidatus Staskawiczbacteria bacterium RIFOXYD1_FULL_39_28]|uniref:Uncharacterized protein n=1 Tax=Candidatus Staskawiczbacteria bacterium RIFOXYC1_FULL_38_18 TaxID=1802229 RepID=A0A1G2JCL5_9BACT|nr:MAG: hypothetical protein A2401_02570 [Candidatus Staskawiczbacteria bacterium RIFOXYC1_FULL_38_18]OGZ90670.1 MAG: hypothetical protein A2599_00685 [Candidatus Staskawiczbacteria bacterium RIFOXYD1_FULL_39_28]